MRRRRCPTPSFKCHAWAALLAVAGWQHAARAECGMPTPDYEARRTVGVGGGVVVAEVHVSSGKVRESVDLGGGARVTIRGLAGGRAVVFDPRSRVGAELPVATGVHLPTRAVDEALPDGTRTRVQQVQSKGRWLEVSRTTCRADGVMLDQTFVSVDGRGREVSGHVRQEDVRLRAQPPPLFEVPPDVAVARGRPSP